MEKEIFKDVPGVEDIFAVSNYGNALFKRSGKISKGYLYPNGYYMIECNKDGTRIFRQYMHILVAELFIPNPNNYPVVNHKDTSSTNNFHINLEWCTQLYNVQHANANNCRDASKTYKGVVQMDLDGNDIQPFDSIKDACIALGKNPRSPMICYACRGKCSTNNVNTAYGYKWRYVE